MIDSSGGSRIISSAQILNGVPQNALKIPTFTSDSQLGLENTLKKLFVSPGSASDLEFTLRSSVIDLDSMSRIIIFFPYYYTPNISRDGFVNCYQGDLEVSCTITKDRVLEVSNLKMDVLKGDSVVILVTGVIQPLAY